jgi:hypothetical protein
VIPGKVTSTEAMGGDGNDENEKSNKIIKKIVKEILIDKTT